MKRFFEIKYAIILSLIGFVTLSCNLNIPEEGEIDADQNALSIKHANYFLAGIYKDLPQTHYLFSVLGPDFVPGKLAESNPNSLELYRWSYVQIKNYAETMWLDYYNTISNCNFLIEKQQTADLSKQENKDILAETLCLKAYAYFQLLSIFAPSYAGHEHSIGIKLKEKNIREEWSEIQKTTEIIEQLLKQAIQLNRMSQKKIFFDKSIAKYLLSTLYLYKGDYKSALQYSKELFDELGGFKSIDSKEYKKLWTKENSKEELYSMPWDKSYYQEIMEQPKEKGDKFLVNCNEDGFNMKFIDGSETECALEQKTFSHLFKSSESSKYIRYLGKYAYIQRTESSVHFNYFFRLAEILFIQSESLARTGNLRKAKELLGKWSQTRNIKLPSINNSNIEELTDLILRCKEMEFIGEGISYFDYKRLNKKLIRHKISYDGSGISEIKTTIDPSNSGWVFPHPKIRYTN